jgi:hypothetical protein
MVRRYAAVFPAAGEEMRVPQECLAEMGLAQGTRVVVEATPGRLLLTPFWDVQAVRSDLGAIARDLAAIRGRLRRVAGLLPGPSGAGLPNPVISVTPEMPEMPETLETPEMAEVGADLLGTLECILADDLEPALAKLQEAVAVTLGELGGME